MKRHTITLDMLSSFEARCLPLHDEPGFLWDFYYRLKDYPIDTIYWSAVDPQLKYVSKTGALKDLNRLVVPYGDLTEIIYPDSGYVLEVKLPRELFCLAKHRAFKDYRKRMREQRLSPPKYPSRPTGRGLVEITDRHVSFFQPNARIEFSNEETRQCYQDNLETVKPHVDRLLEQCRYMSRHQNDPVVLQLSKDFVDKSFYFMEMKLKPEPRMVMNGGIIWREDLNRYSVHT